MIIKKLVTNFTILGAIILEIWMGWGCDSKTSEQNSISAEIDMRMSEPSVFISIKNADYMMPNIDDMESTHSRDMESTHSRDMLSSIMEDMNLLDMNGIYCTEDEERTCMSMCGEGIERCVNGSWSDCDVQQVNEEVCDGLDNNCDGIIDNLASVNPRLQCEHQASREERACGVCQTQFRNCVECKWSPWSVCELSHEAMCITGDEDYRVCGSDVGQCVSGEEVRICDESCQWSTWGICENEITPSAEICGNRIDEDCDGLVSRQADEYESNNTCGTCILIASGESFSVNLNASIDHVDDIDFYCFEIIDRNFTFNSSFHISLENIPINQNYDLELYKDEQSCIDQNVLASSRNENQETESIDESALPSRFSNKSGIYILKVSAVNSTYSCDRDYLLSITWEQ